MNRVVVVMCGLPFSGKSTIAKQLSNELGLQILSYDHDIYAVHKNKVPPGTTAAKEFDMVEAIARDVIISKLKNGESFIYDDLCLEREDRAKIVAVARTCQVEPILIYMDTPLAVIDQRRQQSKESGNRDHIDDEKLQLDISLLQPPHPDEHAILVTPETPIGEIVRALRVRM